MILTPLPRPYTPKNPEMLRKLQTLRRSHPRVRIGGRWSGTADALLRGIDQVT